MVDRFTLYIGGWSRWKRKGPAPCKKEGNFPGEGNVRGICLGDFCRAMLCISAAYAVMRCLSVCLCVRMSVTFVSCVETGNRIVRLILHHSSFLAPNGMAIIRQGPPNGGVECKGVWKKSRFSTNISLYLWNDARYGHSYCGSRIGNRTNVFERY